MDNPPPNLSPSFYEFCKEHKEKFKNTRWSVKQAAYIQYMKKRG